MIKQNKKNHLKTYLVSSLIALFLGVEVFMTIEASTSGSEIAALEKQEATLIDANRELSQGLIKGSSLSSVEKSAEEMGFAKPQSVIYLGKSSSVAKLP